jgi:5'-nucleotidase
MRSLLCVLLLAGACAHRQPAVVTLSVVGTNDLHGHVAPKPDGRGGLALLGGYVANLRRARAADGGGVLLIDAGDMFQGTMDSNLNEGQVVIEGYNALGYDAAAVGNHEFDFGPVGPRVAPAPGDDARGALKARAAQARFPFLAANTLDKSTGRTLFAPSTMKEVAGVKVGIVGVTTWWTPSTTAEVTFRGLEILPLAATIDAEVTRLRAAGAEVVVLSAHAGLCKRVDESDAIQECDHGEIADVVRALSQKVDVVIAGHTHAGVILRLGEVPITEQWNYGRGFGRADVVYDRKAKKILRVDLQKPQLLVPGAVYEGRPVVADEKVAAVIQPFVAAAEARRARKLRVRLATPIPKAYAEESALGNLFADLMLAARPQADAAVTNGGSLRADLPAGELAYGQFFQAYPFDNFVALVKMTGGELRRMFENNLRRDRGILIIGGMRVAASCEKDQLVVRLTREDGRPVGDAEPITVVTSDFLAAGFEGERKATREGVFIDEDHLLREEMVRVLEERGGTLDAAKLFDPNRRRLSYPGERPVTCP